MKNALRRVSGWMAGSTALVAGLSAHGLSTVIIVTVLAAWIIGSDARATRVAQIISAWRGDATDGRQRRVSPGRKGDGPLRQQEAVEMVEASPRRSSGTTVAPRPRRADQGRPAAWQTSGRDSPGTRRVRSSTSRKKAADLNEPGAFPPKSGDE